MIGDACSAEDIRDFFERFLEGWLLKDLEFCAQQTENLSYVVTSGALCAIDCLSGLWAGKNNTGETFRTLVAKYFPPQYSNVNLYDIYRCGLVHQYFPKEGAAVTWGTGRAHLVQKDGLWYLNAQALVQDLRSAFKKYESDLRSDADLQQKFQKRRQEIADVRLARTVPPEEGANSASWQVYEHSLDSPLIIKKSEDDVA